MILKPNHVIQYNSVSLGAFWCSDKDSLINDRGFVLFHFKVYCSCYDGCHGAQIEATAKAISSAIAPRTKLVQDSNS